MKKIVVIGGGTAGWLTALAAQKRYPEASITVIESKEIGILGAGEGSTPNLIPFLNSLNISIKDLIQKTSSTLKIAIKFSNFSEDKNSYYHGFAINRLNPKTHQLIPQQTSNKLPIMDLFYMSQGISQNEYKTSAMALNQNNIPFVPKKENANQESDFDIYNLYSLHFDARALADFLFNIALDRNVKHIDAKIKEFIQDVHGNINLIKLETGEEVQADFIFDCSGFARLINAKVFNTEWISFSSNLPAKKAIPFFLDIDINNIPAYTESTAMDYGWMWKIPLQHRYGCGYVFDSDFLSEDDAKLEVEKVLGHEIISPKTFTFMPGYYKTIWNKNTIAIGLSSGFVEPLEATSIMQSIKILEIALRKDFNIFENKEHHVELVNTQYSSDCEEIRDFLYLHYMTDKTNTEFWKRFTVNNKMPETLKHTIEMLFDQNFKTNEDAMFDPISYYVIMNGNKILSNNFLKNIYESNIHNTKSFDLLANKRKVLSNYFINHSSFIKQLGGLSA